MVTCSPAVLMGAEGSYSKAVSGPRMQHMKGFPGKTI